MNVHHLNKAEIGIIHSIFEISCAIAKLMAAIVVDASHPLYILGGGLCLSGISNIALSFARNWREVNCIVGLNGAMQAVGWPALAKTFLLIFQEDQHRGFFYTLLSTSQNLGAALVPIIVLPAMEQWGPTASMWTPGMISVTYGLLILYYAYCQPAILSSTVQDKKTYSNLKTASISSSISPSISISWKNLLDNTLFSYKVNMLGGVYFFITIVREGIAGWGPMFLHESRGLNSEKIATSMICLEIGNFLGSVSAGWISDTYFNGQRAQVMTLFPLLGIPTILTLLLPYFESIYFTTIPMFFTGFFTFAPYVLVGLYAQEIVPQAYASVAGGYVKFFAQLGGAISGYPLGYMAQHYGWSAIFCLFSIVCGISVLFMTHFLVHSKKQHQD